jgi:hypothetical protein
MIMSIGSSFFICFRDAVFLGGGGIGCIPVYTVPIFPF